MTFLQAHLRLLCVLVAGAMFASGCVTTAAIAPGDLAAVAGLPEDREATLRTADGPATVSGSSEVILRWDTKGGREEDELRLSRLRLDADVLVLPENGARVALNDIWSAEITKPSPGKTAGLVVGIVLGTAALALLTFFVVGVVALSTARF